MFGAGQGKERKQALLKHIKEQFSQIRKDQYKEMHFLKTPLHPFGPTITLSSKFPLYFLVAHFTKRNEIGLALPSSGKTFFVY